jgi:hypothetical protein
MAALLRHSIARQFARRARHTRQLSSEAYRFVDATRLSTLEKRCTAEAAQLADADRKSTRRLATIIEWLDATHLAKPSVQRHSLIFEQMLTGHEAAFVAVTKCWHKADGLEPMVESGAIDSEVAALMEAWKRENPQLFGEIAHVDAKVLMCNTTRLSPFGPMHYVAVVRYEQPGLQPVCCTYVANTQGLGPSLLVWLNEAMHGAPDAPSHMPLQWRLHDVNFARHGIPESARMLGVATPLLDALAFDVAPGVVGGAVVVLFLMSEMGRVLSVTTPG